MNKVLLVGGFGYQQSLWSIARGFEQAGCEVLYLPTRGCIETRKAVDHGHAQEEADYLPKPSHWQIAYQTVDEFQQVLLSTIEREKPELLLWWFSKDDRPPGLISSIREKFPWCKTATHTQDDPWDARQSPHFSEEFEFAVTCCKESVDDYAKRGIKAIVLYPPPALDLHGSAKPATAEECDLSVTIVSVYARSDGDRSRKQDNNDAAAFFSHDIGFPDQRMLREEVVVALKDLGRIHIYGGLGFGTFEGVSRSAYRGFRTYFELPGIYAASKVNINQHNSPLSYGYLNQRDTAITGSGGFMLTDYVEGIEEIFEIGTEIDTWQTAEELQEKAKWWLAHDRQREQAAKRAQTKILDQFSNVAYAEKLMHLVMSS